MQESASTDKKPHDFTIKKPEPVEIDYASLRDKDGNPFDPDMHRQVEVDGQKRPKVTPNGFLERKNGRKKGVTQRANRKKRPDDKSQSTVSDGKEGEREAARIAEDAKKQAEIDKVYQASGTAAAGMFVMLGTVIGGEEWQPRKKQQIGYDEADLLASSFSEYFKAKGIPDLPPGWALASGLLMYAAPRFMMPKTKTRVQALREWVGGAVGRWRMRKKSTRPPAPQTPAKPKADQLEA